MADLISAANNALDLVKKLREAHKAVSEADSKMLLADLTTELSEVKLAAADLRDQIVTLRQENAALKEAAERREAAEPEVVEGCYVFPGSDRKSCIACYEDKGKRIPVVKVSGPFVTFGNWKCPSCDTYVR